MTVIFILTVIYILTVVYILIVVSSSLSDSSQQHSPHFYLMYVYVNKLGRNDLITANKLTHYLPKRSKSDTQTD